MTRWNAVGSGGTTINSGSGLPYFSSDTAATKFGNDFLLPLAGGRDYDSSATVYNQGTFAYYWSSSPDPSSSSARSLEVNLFYVSAYNGNDRALGFSLRCFQDS
jgi:hypothetical protein